MTALLNIENLIMEFGGLRAIEDIDLEVGLGQIVAVIGPNGAGKTTLFNCITGMYHPTRGNIWITAPSQPPKNIIGLKPNQVTESGLARTFQNIRLFANMTVLENVMVGFHCRTTSGIFSAIFRNKHFKTEEQQVIHNSYRLLKEVGLATYSSVMAKNLPYAAQRRLEIARALATQPLLLLLDEPAAGMNPQETSDLDKLIVQIRNQYHLSILIIEHDMKLVMNISDKIYVLDYGKKIAEGSPGEIQKNPAVIRAYLGEDITD
ncbi:MAG: ABC transporter ATP-binding protein [SAR324 cluster bacterium]|nr:ABC transporter ATP-binding protein [SAR324 cluster bacterium]